MTLIEAIDDHNLFRPWFKDAATWKAWGVVLKALFGLPMTKAEARLFTQLTGRERPPTTQASEGWLIVGRRGGKSFITALVGVFLSAFRQYDEHLAPGERGTVMVLASDRRQARVILRYVKALLQVPMLAQLVENETAEGVDLTNRISIEIHTASFRSTRGYTIVAVLCDEIAFWRSDESANPDKEILDAVRPAMSTIPGAMLLAISSAYRRSGELYRSYRDHYGQDGSVLVVRADTATMNPTVPRKVIAEAYERDPAAAASEYGAEFRSDIAAFLDGDWVTGAVIEGRFELPPVAETTYKAFCDPSGGRHDNFGLAIAHHDDGRAVLDVCRHRKPPFDPSTVVAEFCEVLKAYGCTLVVGDRYAAQWTVEAFRKQGLSTRRPTKRFRIVSRIWADVGYRRR